MIRKNIVPLAFILAVFILALLVVFPVGKGILLSKDILLGLDLKGGIHLVYEADLSQVEAGKEDEIMDGVIAVIANRINPLGVTEPVIERQGENRIAVDLPGLDITDTQKERIGRTALLEFRELITDEQGKEVWIPAKATVNGQELVLTSSYFKENTDVRSDQYGRIELVFEWDETGAQLSEEITSRLLGEPLGIFEGDTPLLGEDGHPIAPIVQSVITDRGVITGLSATDALELSKQLNAGRLPVPLEIIYEQTVSPTLGSDFIDLSLKAGAVGIVLIMLFMIAFYRVPGLVASLALIFYGAIVIAIFKVFSVTLTLAGIGGFILSIGMAVDANVLIFERMKEEMRSGRTLGAAIEAGFNRAWTAIRDSNITTFIVCMILIAIGSNIAAGAPVQGFGVTLFIGVAVSMFTAIMVTRTLLRLFVGSRLSKKLKYFTSYAGKSDA